MIFPPKRENVHLDAVEDNVVALIYPIESLWHWFAALLCGKKWNKNRRPNRHRSKVES